MNTINIATFNTKLISTEFYPSILYELKIFTMLKIVDYSSSELTKVPTLMNDTNSKIFDWFKGKYSSIKIF
jgi:hypothetical protein